MAMFFRYIRLTPTFAIGMLFYYQIWPFLAAGPFAADFQDSVYRRCDGSWWSELLYLMNFIPFDSDKVCMGWTWYLGNDWWFFVVTLMVLPLYYRNKLLGWMCVTLLTAASFGVTIYLVYHYHLSVKYNDSHYLRYSYYAYSKPWCRIPAYFVGVVTHWVLDAIENRGFTRSTAPRSSKASAVSVGLWLLAVSVMVFLAMIPATDHGKMSNDWSDTVSMLYITFSRPLWSLCLAVITLLCYFDYCSCWNAVMSHRLWNIPMRLTYGAYIAHPMVIKLAAGRAVQYYEWSVMNLFYRIVGNVVCAYVLSALFWVMIEQPIGTLADALKPQKKKAMDKASSANTTSPTA
jgi:hypothetical protein